MDTRDFAIFYPRLAAELRQIGVDAMPACGQTPCGPGPARHVDPDVAFATAFVPAVTVWLVIGLTRRQWAERVWIPATVTGLLIVVGIGGTARRVRALVTYWGVGRR